LGSEKEEQDKSTRSLLLLEDMLCTRIKQKKREIQNFRGGGDDKNMAYIESLWTEIGIIQWVLGTAIILTF
jgi:hypothetical protein